MTSEEIFWGFLIELGRGALIGLQRQQSRDEEKGPGDSMSLNPESVLKTTVTVAEAGAQQVRQ